MFGTLFFFLRVAAMVIVGLDSDDFDDMEGDVEVDDLDPDASQAAFKLLSIHSVTGFCMMFGWGGLTAYKQFGTGAVIATGVASVAGFATMYATAWLFKLASHMTARGAQFSLKDVVGKDATVYLKISKGGRGKIQVGVEGITRMIEAVSDDGSEIESFKVVQIMRAMDSSTVAVRRKD